MKKFSLLLFSTILILSACSKDEEIVSEENYEATEDLANFHDIINDAEVFYTDNVEVFFSNPLAVEIRNDCPEITYGAPQGEYPNSITVDFGDYCEGPGGRIRSGKIVFEVSAPIKEVGATRSTSFIGFTVDEVEFNGQKSLTNTEVDADGNVTLLREVDGTVSYPNGTSASFESDHILTQIEGGDTNQKYDDVVEITGSSSGVGRMGKTFSSLITTPLLKERPCRWFVSGVKEITIEAGTLSLDYGDGNCDFLGTLTLPNGDIKTVRVFRKFW